MCTHCMFTCKYIYIHCCKGNIGLDLIILLHVLPYVHIDWSYFPVINLLFLLKFEIILPFLHILIDQQSILNSQL